MSKYWPKALGLRATRRLNIFAAALLLTGVLSGSPSRAEPAEQVPGLLLGGSGALKHPGGGQAVRIDPALPRGAKIVVRSRPLVAASLCSALRPVCVHWSDDTKERADDAAKRRQRTSAPPARPPSDALAAALRQLEQAYTRAVVITGLPPARADGSLGGGPELDLYLNSSDEAFWLDPALLDTDSASGFCTHRSTTLDVERATRCVAEATAARLDAAETPALRGAYGAFVSEQLQGTSSALQAASVSWQADPQLTALGREPSSVSLAARAWFEFLERSLAREPSLGLPTALFALSRAVTSDAHPLWNNEPDVLDVVRHSLDNDGRRWAAHWRDFAVQRALWGGVGVSVYPERARIALDWELEYSSLPRRVAGGRSLEPLGSAVVALKLDDIPIGARLGVVLEWEEPGAFVWSVLALDQGGLQMKRWDLPYLERGYRLEQTLMDFEGAARLLFIGTNLGGIDLAHPFDPDHEPWEPHAYSLYVASLL